MEDIIKKLKKEHNKTAEWISYINHKMNVMESRLDRIDEVLKEMKENQNLIAQHILHFHEHLGTKKE